MSIEIYLPKRHENESSQDKNNTDSNFINANNLYSGLDNHGSTCYLNSVLQCLSHTEDLTKYFLKECFKKEINIGNSNTKGNFLDVYYRMISLLWNASGYSHDDGYYNNDYYPEYPEYSKPIDDQNSINCEAPQPINT